MNKIRVSMKTPDALDNAIADACGDDEVQQKAAKAVASRYFKYGECCVIEIDVDEGTVVVLRV